jgi:hypothetical protein
MPRRSSASLAALAQVLLLTAQHDIWEQKDLGVLTSGDSFGPPAPILPRDSSFFMLSMSKQLTAASLKTDDSPPMPHGAGAGAPAWSGPDVRIAHGSSGRVGLSVDGAPPVAPLWLTLHVHQEGGFANESLFNFSVVSAARAGVNFICVCLTCDNYSPHASAAPWFSDAAPLDEHTRRFLDIIIELNPSAIFIVRFYAHLQEAENVLVLNLTDDGPLRVPNMNAVTPAWATEVARRMTTMLSYLDSQYPRRVGGVFPCSLTTSEWFLPMENSFPTKAAEYSNASREAYCAWRGAPADCALPKLSQRHQPAFGNGFSDAESAGANLFYSHTIVDAIITLTAAAKKLSGGKMFTTSFYGYLFALSNRRLVPSGHLALQRLLDEVSINAIASPYSYEASVRNVSLGPLLVHGPWDAPPLHGKMWFVESDTRTVWACLNAPPQYRNLCPSLETSIATLRRNIITSRMHGAGIYLYDLGSAGWFAQPDAAAGTAQMWAAIRNASDAVSPDRSSAVTTTRGAAAAAEDAATSLILPVQIAVLVDDLSATRRTVMDISDDFSRDMMKGPRDALSIIGAPIRTVLLSDLLLPEADWSAYRFFVFANAFVISPALRVALDKHCRRSGATLLWQYAAGLYEANVSTPSIEAMCDVVQLPLLRGPGAIHPRIMGAGFGQYGDHYPPADPWFHLDVASPVASSVEVLGHLAEAPTNATSAGLVRMNHPPQGYTSIFSAAPGLPTTLWRILARDAGVHLYVDCVGDAVEAQGDMLTLHAAASCGEGIRQVKLPVQATVVDERGATLCSACDNFATQSLRPGDHRVYTLTQPRRH